MKSHKEILELLKEQFENHRTPINDYENQVFPKIKETKWATEPQFHLELLKIERARLPKGKIYKEETNHTSIKLGFDDQNRIIYEERADWDSSGGYKKFIFYKEESIWAYKYYENKIEGVEYQTLIKGTPKTFASFEKGVVDTVDKYEYNNGKLVIIDSYSTYEPYNPQTPNYEITYNKLGDILEIKRIDEPSDFFPKGQNLVIFKKHDYSIKSLTDILVFETTDLIKKELKNQSSADRECLLLFVSNSFNSDDWFPPRFSLIKPNSVDSLDLRIDEMIDFDLVSFSDELISTKRLKEASNLLMQEIELKEKYELPFKIILRIAKDIKSWYSENINYLEIKDNLTILPLDFPDDYYEDISSVLQRIYSKAEIKKLENNTNKELS